MALPAPNLDDRKFQDIVDEAKRLIPQFCPEWTNHNVSDPGVALIELFAWMSEMVLFRINQVPERLYVHFLDLVGIEPFPPSVARADVTFFLSAVLDHPITIPAGTEVTTTGATDREAAVFTTLSDAVVQPPQLVTALTSSGATPEMFRNVWEDLRFDGASVTCFPSDPLRPGDACYLGFEETLAGAVLRLQVEATAEGIGVDPRHAPLVWEVWNGEGWITAALHQDSTGGLNRDGAVVLLVPVEHEQLTLGGVRAYWLRARLIPPAPGQPTYQASPQLRRLTASAIGGTARAEHAALVGQEVLGRSTGRPGQVFVLGRSPVLPRQSGEVVRIVDGDVVTEWSEVSDFSASGPDDQHVVWEASTGTVRFGPRIRYADGSVRQHGAIPRDGAEVLVTGYRHGGGSIGNVGAQTLTVLRSTTPYVDTASNLTPASGGVDAESVAEAKERGPLTLRTGQRAVTPGDFERLAREASVEVARTRCLPAAVPGGPVRVLVVPHVRSEPDQHRLDDFALSPPLLSRLRAHLDERRLVGTSIEVGTPFYQGISIAALLRAQPGRPAPSVRQRAVQTLAAYVNPLTGGPDGYGWPFDTDLNTAVLAQLLEQVEGVDRVDEVLLFEYDLRTGQRLGGGRDAVRLDEHSLFLSAAPQVVVR